MALGVVNRATIADVAALADDYAKRVADGLPGVESEELLRRGLAGAFLTFLSEALLLAHSRRE